MRRIAAIGFALSFVSASAAEINLSAPEVQSASRGINVAGIRGHMRFLADDLLEGRGTGTRGYDLAARYVAAQMEAARIHPAGDAGTYFQNIPFRQALVDVKRSGVRFEAPNLSIDLAAGQDYVVAPSFLEPEAIVTAPVIYVGYGITAPALQHDDYAGVDARGKIVAYFSGSPADWPSTMRAHYRSAAEKQRNAAAHGAVGVLNLRTDEEANRLPFNRVVRLAQAPRMRAIGPDVALLDVIPEMRGVATLNQESSRRLFAGAPITFEQAAEGLKARKARAVRLPVKATIRTVTTFSELASSNVVGLVRGSDPELSAEHVIYTAHLDHLGIGPAINGDAIYNGAIDNASGVSALLEVAKAFAELPRPPRRSVIFLFVTGEEKGLLGSAYFASFPTVPRASLVANLNLDAVALTHPVRDLVAFGEEHSTLRDAVRAVGLHLGLPISPDPFPEQGFFTRSDQYSFVRVGIPAVFMDAGLASHDPAIRPKEIVQEWLRKVYHTPKDDLSQDLDFNAGAQIARAQFLLGLIVANSDERPRWNRGDFFARRAAP